MKPSIASAMAHCGRGGRSAVLFAFTLIFASITGAQAQERRYMISAANPLAAAAGAAVLANGGGAADAAVAVQAVLGLVEPQSSGIGGGAFLLYYDAASKKVSAFDGRETAPATAGPDLFTTPDGEPMKWRAAMLGGRSVGAPGVVALLAKVQNAYGKRPWAGLFDEAIRLAEVGFAVSPRLNKLISGDKWLAGRPATGAYFFTPGANGENVPLPVGYVLKNAAYAASLKRIATDGPKGFYEGPIAEAILETVRTAGNPGLLSADDLANYQAKIRPAVCRPYRAWQVCGMPPPTSGGVTVLQTLALLERFDLGAMGPGSAQAVHLISEASKLAFADRNTYLADPDFVDQPVAALLSPGYVAARSALIDPARSMGRAKAGEPLAKRSELAPNLDGSFPSTSHFSIVDGWGNAVTMTTSVESAFGSHEMAAGFLLNNQLTDFSFRAQRDGKLVANRVQGGKRPRSSMSPTFILDRDGNFVAAIGTPGGSRIIGYVALSVVALLDWDLTMAQTVALPHFVNRNGSTDLEAGTSLEALQPALEALGQKVKVRGLNSGLHGIMRKNGRLQGGADPRREGVVLEGVVTADAN